MAEYIQSRTADDFLIQCLDEILFFDNRAAGNIDETGVWLHALEHRQVKQASGVRRQWQTDDHIICCGHGSRHLAGRKQLIDKGFTGRCLFDGQYFHAHTFQMSGYFMSDTSQANDSGSFSIQLINAAQSLPGMCLLVIIGREQTTAAAQHHAEDMLSDGNAVDAT